MNFRKMLCAALDHPPVVNACFGEISCARCDEVVGDTLMRGTSLDGLMVVGHECEDCDQARAGLTFPQRLGTTLDRPTREERDATLRKFQRAQLAGAVTAAFGLGGLLVRAVFG